MRVESNQSFNGHEFLHLVDGRTSVFQVDGMVVDVVTFYRALGEAAIEDGKAAARNLSRNLADVTEAKVTEFATGEFAVDASDLGLRPGQWPDKLTTDLGNKLPLLRVDLNETRGLYRQVAGCIEVSVLND